MTWAEFAGSGLHNWLVLLAVLLLFAAWLRAVRLNEEAPAREHGTEMVFVLDDPAWQAVEDEKNRRASRLGYSRGSVNA